MYKHFNNDKLEKVIQTSSDKIDAQCTSVHQKSSSLKSREGDPPNSLGNTIGKVIHHFHVDYYVKMVIHTTSHFVWITFLETGVNADFFTLYNASLVRPNPSIFRGWFSNQSIS